MAQPGVVEHAGVRLAPDVLAGAPPAEQHPPVEPIPWRTGRVGVVPPLDGVTASAAGGPAPTAAATPATPATPATAATPATPDAAAPASPPAAASGSQASAATPPTTKARPKKKLPGSGIPPRRIAVVLKWARRVSQAGFFALFMYFLFQTGFRGSFAARADSPVRLPLPVEGFLLADPFVAAMTALSTHTVYRGLLWSIGLLALTMLVGRVFCGWICPFGTLHHFFAWIL
ncbi:MAG TPA: 4Fe-4S binding protein, partial [Polyangiaceae bacterium]|nr:4Fe-4S binding protein [Polyangiaceae bacterium]